jgi:hypothetical protein
MFPVIGGFGNSNTFLFAIPFYQKVRQKKIILEFKNRKMACP